MPIDGHHYGVYVVGFFDLLNQRQELARLDMMPEDGAGREKHKQEIIRIRRIIQHFRGAFTSFFNSYKEVSFEIPGLNEEQQQWYSRIRQTELKMQSFSDSIITFARVSDDGGQLNVSGLYAILSSAAATMLSMLAEGNVFRGGIAISTGADFGDPDKGHSDFYGSALSMAHSCESEYAKHPRIIVHPRIGEFLKAAIEAEPGGYRRLAQEVMAGCCSQLIRDDYDGLPMLDFLSVTAGLPQTEEEQKIEREHIIKAFQFVQREYMSFRRKRNAKLAERYYILLQYFIEKSVQLGILRVSTAEEMKRDAAPPLHEQEGGPA